jgi:hypothetical protein
LKSVHDEELLKGLRENCRASRIDTTAFGVREMIYVSGSPLDALVYSRLLWPDFVEIEGMVFMEGTIEDEEDRQRLGQALDEYNKDFTLTEQAFNLVEVPSDLFGRRAAETTEEQDHWLAERLAEMWRARLHLRYPAQQFVVKVLEPKETGGEVGVVFYQVRN